MLENRRRRIVSTDKYKVFYVRFVIAVVFDGRNDYTRWILVYVFESFDDEMKRNEIKPFSIMLFVEPRGLSNRFCLYYCPIRVMFR